MRTRRGVLALFVAGALASCSDQAPTEPQVADPQFARPTTQLIQNVTGTLTGGTFTGTANITNFAVQNGQLVVSGVLNGVATIAGIPTTITNQPFTTSAALVSPNQVCDVLFLDLGPLFLDLLGLTVDLSQIVLDINAVPGPGNLLGNLLCAVVNLLNGPGSGGGLQGLLNLINNLLG